MQVEIRADNTVEISGYVNVVERESRAIRRIGEKPFYETVKTGTFQKAIDRGKPIKLKLNHGRTLCDTNSGLELREDSVGLHARAVVSDEETVNAARAKRLTGWSFGFTCNSDKWSGDREHRTLEDINLNEVSILTQMPAYIATSIEVRGSDLCEEIRCGNDIEIINDSSEKYQNDYERRMIEFANKKRRIEVMKMKSKFI